jgi:hypothetical protein
VTIGGAVLRDAATTYFGEGAVDLVFLIDTTGSTLDSRIRAGVKDTVDTLGARLGAQGRQFRVAGVKFSNVYTNVLDPLLPNSKGELFGFTTSIGDFKTWVDGIVFTGQNEYQLDILEYAKSLSPSSTPGLYMALATDENSDSTLSINAVAADLDASNAIVFIDPGRSGDDNHPDYWGYPLDLFAYYAPLAVNGGVVETEYGVCGYFTYPHMCSAISGRP